VKDRDDAIPEPIVTNEWSTRQTAELCGDAAHGLRCMLRKGHPGKHECLALNGPTRWDASGLS
jgi:hypothetical protein